MQARTAEFKQARDVLLNKMNTSKGDALAQVQADNGPASHGGRAKTHRDCQPIPLAAEGGLRVGGGGLEGWATAALIAS